MRPSSQNRLSTEVVVVTGNMLGSLFVVGVVVVFVAVVVVLVVVVVVRRSDFAADVNLLFDSVTVLELDVEDVVCLADDLAGFEVLIVVIDDVVLDDDGVDFNDVVGEAVVVRFEDFVFFVVVVKVVDEGSA